MFFKNIIKELIQVRNINVSGIENEKLKTFYKSIRHSKNESVYHKKIIFLKEIAKIIDVPINFIIRIIQLERIEENVKKSRARFKRYN